MPEISEQDFFKALQDSWNEGYTQAVEMLQYFADNVEDEGASAGLNTLIKLLEAGNPGQDTEIAMARLACLRDGVH